MTIRSSKNATQKRREAAFRLRAKGKTFGEIACALGVSKPTARADVMRRMAALAGSPDHAEHTLVGQVAALETAAPGRHAKGGEDIATCLAALQMRCEGASSGQIADRFCCPPQYRGAVHQYANSLVARALTFLKNNPGHPEHHLFNACLAMPRRRGMAPRTAEQRPA